VVDSLSKRLGVGGYLTMPTVADIDNDGRNELIAIDEKGFLYIWDTQGSSCEASEWPTFGGDASRSRVYKHPRGDPYVFGCGATVEFKLVDSRGLPISGVAVSAGSLGRRISDVNGVVRFGGLPLGFHYSLSLESPVYSFSPVEGVVRGDEVVTVSGRAPELSLGGLIKDSDNQPISGVVVDGGPCGIAISGADGRFILPAGEYGRECQLQPKHPGVLFQQVSGITVSAASQEVVITGSWKHFSFLGRVVNRGRAISQATISLPGGRVLSANSQGRFRVRGIRYGTRLKMTVAAKGFKSRRVTVVVRSAQGVVVGLQRR
jgi:hypothetical protein